MVPQIAAMHQEQIMMHRGKIVRKRQGEFAILAANGKLGHPKY
jgi:hypothetical protein